MIKKSTITYNYLEQQDKMPRLCPKENETEIKELILNKLFSEELLYLATSSPNGWPIVDCMHFVTVKGTNNTPILYLFTHYNTRKIENIINDERVSISICHTKSYEERNKSCSFQFMCKAEMVTDLTEKNLAIKYTREKKGYDFTINLPLEMQPCIKIQPIFGSWMCGEGNPSICSIEY